MFKNHRKHNAKLLKLKGMAPDNKIPRGLLRAQSEELDAALANFEQARNADSMNEKMPT